MTYKLKTNDGIRYHKWFFSAWVAGKFESGDYNGNQSFKEVFNEHYGYELEGDADFIIFPNEAEATLFILRWS
jgi:hypothetical protein